MIFIWLDAYGYILIKKLGLKREENGRASLLPMDLYGKQGLTPLIIGVELALNRWISFN